MTDLPPRIRRTLELPQFWRGAANARVELYAADDSLLNGRGIVRAQTIEQKRAAGCPLHELPEFVEWMQSGVGRRARP